MGRMKEGHITVNVSGRTIDEIASMDITKTALTKKSLSELTSRLVSAANKRLARLERTGADVYSPAYQGRVPKGANMATRFSIRGKSYKDIQNEYIKAKQFLFERETSSVTGARRVKSELEERLGIQFHSKEEANNYWEMIKKAEELDVIHAKYTSGQLQRDIADMYAEGVDFDQMLQDVISKSTGLYEKSVEKEDSPFEIEEQDEEQQEDDFIPSRFEKVRIF